ncbi:hypothetical protein NDU88_005172 [Pleurodeles waltl]|uniref:Uncharacterized protein n=1 Tax=Pleurodeles waltl TaxID=8319 RepID=A0AAV7MVM2_PLEWA|nr:hypothetical protein NDU88_005172 [Pleurodeles waltl]
MATANADGVGNPLDGDTARSTLKALLCTHSNQLEHVNEASTRTLDKKKKMHVRSSLCPPFRLVSLRPTPQGELQTVSAQPPPQEEKSLQ